jgi:hypothetical protein
MCTVHASSPHEAPPLALHWPALALENSVIRTGASSIFVPFLRNVSNTMQIPPDFVVKTQDVDITEVISDKLCD